jgi:predicted hydrolase (HD superfamily)
MEDTEIMDIWDLFLEHIPEKHRDVAASQYVEYLLNHDVEIDTLDALVGNDEYLDNAIEEAIEEASYNDDEDSYNDGDE